MDRKYKLLILVMCSSSSKFKKLEKAIKATWGSISDPEVKILFYTDNQKAIFKSSKALLKDKDLILPCKDGYLECTEKTLQAFEFVSQHFDFDYVFRTNLGSYVYINNILGFLNEKPKKHFYSGIIGNFTEGNSRFDYASGSGYFLSNDLVRLIAQKRSKIDMSLIDDVALGKFISSENIQINREAKRLSFTNDGITYQVGNKTVDYIAGSLIYHIRLRSDDRKMDIQKMHELFAKTKAYQR